MKMYAVLVISFDDDYKNTEDSYDVKLFHSDEERLNHLVNCYEDTLCDYEINNFKYFEFYDENKVVIKNEFKSYKSLYEISYSVLEGEYVKTNLSFELFEFDM